MLTAFGAEFLHSFTHLRHVASSISGTISVYNFCKKNRNAKYIHKDIISNIPLQYLLQRKFTNWIKFHRPKINLSILWLLGRGRANFVVGQSFRVCLGREFDPFTTQFAWLVFKPTRNSMYTHQWLENQPNWSGYCFAQLQVSTWCSSTNIFKYIQIYLHIKKYIINK